MLRAIPRPKEPEQPPRHREQSLPPLPNHLAEAVSAYDMERNLVFVNPAMEKLTGYSVAELRERGFMSWVHPADRSSMLERWERLFLGQTVEDVEYRLIAKDGRALWAISSSGPVYDES